jgi:hypothetical protein
MTKPSRWSRLKSAPRHRCRAALPKDSSGWRIEPTAFGRVLLPLDLSTESSQCLSQGSAAAYQREVFVDAMLVQHRRVSITLLPSGTSSRPRTLTTVVASASRFGLAYVMHTTISTTSWRLVSIWHYFMGMLSIANSAPRFTTRQPSRAVKFDGLNGAIPDFPIQVLEPGNSRPGPAAPWQIGVSNQSKCRF